MKIHPSPITLYLTPFIVLLLAASCLLPAGAQQPRRVTKTWFQNPDVTIATPAFKHSSGFTSYKEMMDYVAGEASAHPSVVSVETVGQTQRGLNIPLVKVSNGSGDEKLRVFYTGAVHGNEHAGTEGLLWLIHQLANDGEVGSLLNDIDFYILPMVNADGSEADRRQTNDGTDANRDQTRLSTPEVECMHRVATRVMPHVFVDFHEFKPLRTAYDELSDRLLSNPNDYMYLYSSNPNVWPALTDVVERCFIADAELMAKQWGLTSSLYYTTKSDFHAGTVMNIGGHAARSSSNIMALRGSISLLMEVRGVGLGRTSYLRRVNTVYQLACSFARTARDNATLVRQVTAEARTGRRDIVTQYSVPVEKNHPFEFLDLLKNTKTTIAVDAHPARQLTVQKQVSRPESYYVDASAVLAIDLIRKFGIRYEELDAPMTLSLETYRVTSLRVQSGEVLGMRPVKVAVEGSQQSVLLPAGSIRIPMDQPLATLAAILLEPECSNGFVNFRVVEAAEGQTLPIYRKL